MSHGDLRFGAVFFWRGFEFEDGGSSDKLLVLLGARQNLPYIAVLTTSQRYWPENVGCHAEDGYFFFRDGGTAKFSKDTWIDLRRVWEIHPAEIVKAALAKDVIVRWNLPQNDAAAIRNCLKRSKDISPYQITLLE